MAWREDLEMALQAQGGVHFSMERESNLPSLEDEGVR